jgi:hypothetical protein
MPITSFPEYARQIEDVLNAVVATGEATVVDLKIDHRSSLHGFLSGMLRFSDHSELHFREFVDTSQPEPRLMYAYHYQDAQKTLVFRYDNAAHRPPLLQAEHKHTPGGVDVSHAPTLSEVVAEILR